MGRFPYILCALSLFVMCAAPPASHGKKRPVACAPGEFLTGAPVFGGAGSDDSFLVTANAVEILGKCPPATTRLKAKKKGTLLKVRWAGCTGVTGPVTMNATIGGVGCATLTAKLKTPKAKPKKRKLTATRSPCDIVSRNGAPFDPGHVTLHRLNRAEYNNTVRDLLGDTTRPADDFPPDDHGYGFDNNADVLAFSPLLLEKIEVAAQTVVTNAIGSGPPAPLVRTFEAETARHEGDFGAVDGSAWALLSAGAVMFDVTVDAPGGAHDLVFVAWGFQAGPDPTRAAVVIDGTLLGTYDVTAEVAAPQTITLPQQTFAPGTHEVRIEFVNDYYAPPLDSNLYIDLLRVTGPPLGAQRGPLWTTLVPCAPEAIGAGPCATQALGAFARRAWRRPVTADEVAKLAAVVTDAVAAGDAIETAMGLGFQAVLVSPDFLFRVERDPDPASTTPHPLSAHELAARLSYFLWSSTPDETLLALADAGTLDTPEALTAQVARMIADPKASALTENFGGQWLYTRALDDVNPDYAYYPDWDATLQESMRLEANRFFEAFLREDRSVADMLDADFTFLNDRLARHYGLPAPGSDDLQRVTLATPQRGGLLTLGSILTVTSRAKRTSPVKRGKFVLGQLLCSEPPAPPPNVEALPEPENPSGTLRERLAAHRSKPECQTCHQAMDSIGFSLEPFDGIGAWRTTDNGAPIDTSGELPGGQTFADFHELVGLLKTNPGLASCLAERFTTYATGHGFATDDRCLMQATARSFVAEGASMQDLLTAIVLSDAFRLRRGEP